MSPNRRGPSLSPALVDSVLALLGHPVVAAVLGIALGAGLLLTSRASFKAITPDSMESGLIFAAISLFVRMALAAAVLFLYFRFISEGFVPFAAGVAGGFVVLYTVELVRYGKVLARPR
ncbi:MAG: hypothetical protein RQ731_08375 [Anaerosomatales bacterium]|nr:hypothetical protein [Anaerosomatales bacterium]MDT8434753.1 hypothetical protein [Anaerosomatales bacterium]